MGCSLDKLFNTNFEEVTFISIDALRKTEPSIAFNKIHQELNNCKEQGIEIKFNEQMIEEDKKIYFSED